MESEWIEYADPTLDDNYSSDGESDIERSTAVVLENGHGRARNYVLVGGLGSDQTNFELLRNVMECSEEINATMAERFQSLTDPASVEIMPLMQENDPESWHDYCLLMHSMERMAAPYRAPQLCLRLQMLESFLAPTATVLLAKCILAAEPRGLVGLGAYGCDQQIQLFKIPSCNLLWAPFKETTEETKITAIIQPSSALLHENSPAELQTFLKLKLARIAAKHEMAVLDGTPNAHLCYFKMQAAPSNISNGSKF